MTLSITVQRLIENPLIAYSIQIPKPEFFEISEYEKSAYPAIIGNLTSLSIQSISPKYRLGRIVSMDVFPRPSPDPIIIFSPIGDLKEYYSIWGEIMGGGIGFFRKKKTKKYDNAMKRFYMSAEESGLTKHEIVFATIEMLKFKNDVLLNETFL